MSSSPVLAVDECPDANLHTPRPDDIFAHSKWANQMTLTHHQHACGTCGLLVVWVQRDDVHNLTVPAVSPGNCSRCSRRYEENTPIRSDGHAGWIAQCCLAVTDA